jgi:hypothetical protein
MRELQEQTKNVKNTPSIKFNQNNVEDCLTVILGTWKIDADRPKSISNPKKDVIKVIIAIKPKSDLFKKYVKKYILTILKIAEQSVLITVHFTPRKTVVFVNF